MPETDKITPDKNLAIVIKILLKNYAKIIYSLLTNGYKDVIIFKWQALLKGLPCPFAAKIKVFGAKIDFHY
ncbi:MAG: hypothetical protein IJM98_07055 [Oscillospiraceae bacterium]|nr:hypothetical protein [Oscillospiraceae bacterium]MBQ6700409.1 hypothetical protein [Oscillospiraceae bacterium]